MLGGAVIAPVSAQDAEEEFDINQLEGLQRAVGRFYYGDYSAMFDTMSTPGATMSGDMLLGVSIGVFEFDNDDHAKDAVDKLVDEAKKSFESGEMEDMGTPVAAGEIKEEDVDDIGDDAKGLSVTVDDEGMQMTDYLLLVRDGNRLLFLAGNGTGDVTGQINNIAKGMADRDPGDGDGTFNEDGTSTGGLWDIFPASDDEAIKGLTNGGDEVIFPEDEGTPEA
jgi:hypothetical protein